MLVRTNQVGKAMTYDPKAGRRRGLRFGTRLLAGVMLWAVVPTAIVGLIAFERVSSYFADEKRDGMDSLTKAYGGILIERIRAVGTLAEPVQANIAAGRPALAGIASDVATAIQSVATVSRDGMVSWTYGTTSVLPAGSALATGSMDAAARETLVLEMPDNGGRYHIAVAKSLRARGGGGWLLLFVSEDYVWAGAGGANRVCVFGADTRVLYCSHPVADDLREELRKQKDNSGTFSFRAGSSSYLAGYWRAAMGAIHGKGEWTIVAFDNQTAFMGPVSTLRLSFWATIAVSALLAAFVASLQLRRAFTPVARARDGARRIADGDFSARVPVTQSDEFGALAADFNAMAERLGRRWATLRAWSEVDRVILANVDVEPVASLVLEQLPEIIGCDVASITVFDRDGTFGGDIYTRDLVSRSAIFKDRADPPSEEMRGLIAETGDFTTFCLEGPGRCLVPHRRMGAHESRVFPVVAQSRLLGLLTLGLRDGQTLIDEDMANVRALCERLAVALDAAHREERLYMQANFDAVTGLASRVAFRARLGEALARAERAKSKVGLLFLDLDGFKRINDTHGHAAGDELLHTVGKRLQDCVRKTDVVARIGGDEFAVLLPELRGVHAAEGVSQQILDALGKPLTVGGRSARVGGSIGIALYPVDGMEIEELFLRADLAMYRAKERGGHRFAFYHEDMDRIMQERAGIEEALGAALDAGGIAVHYQPQVDTQSGECVGVEALARWPRDDGALVPPEQFIAAAEESELAVRLGDHVLNTALSDFAQWRKLGVAPKRVAVNVSIAQFRAGKLAPRVAEALTRHHVSPGALDIEVPEVLCLADGPAIRSTIAALVQMGVGIVIDDFGISNSSLAHIKRLRARAIKIDRSFVSGVPSDAESVALVKAILAMARTLGKEVIAEGVEAREQALFLREIGCPAMQGFLVARPQPATAINEFLRKPHPVGEGVVWFPFGRKGGDEDNA
jgi:diguanylate cyclase (GGDEF)-like protein